MHAAAAHAVQPQLDCIIGEAANLSKSKLVQAVTVQCLAITRFYHHAAIVTILIAISPETRQNKVADCMV